MKLTKTKQRPTITQIRSIVFDYFWKKYEQYGGEVHAMPSDKIIQLFAEILDRFALNDFRNLDICENDGNIYTDDHWEILKEYSEGPENANWTDAYNSFWEDLSAIAGELVAVYA